MNGKKNSTVIARSALVLCDEAISNTVRRLLWAALRLRVSTCIRPSAQREYRPQLFLIFLLSSFLIASCTTSTPPPTPQVVSVYSSLSAEPWLSGLYDCAASQNNVILSRVEDSNAAEIVLRIGEPEFLSAFAYQIDTEEILIVTQRQSSVQNLTLDDARALFMGLGDPSVQVWVYASDADVQMAFDQLVMKGGSVTSSAKVAVSPQQMSDTLVNQPNTVGILPKHWKVGDSRFVYTIQNVPVLALTKSEPAGVVKSLLACLQK